MKCFFLACLLASHLSAVELEVCPEKVPPEHIVLQSNEAKCVQLKIEVANQSNSLKNMIKDLGEDTSHIIPLSKMDNSLLKDVATIMEQAFKQEDEVIRDKLASITKSNSDKLLALIEATSFLDIPPVLHAGLYLLSKKIFEEDLPRLGTLNADGYLAYKKKVLKSLPNDLTRLMLEQNWSIFPPTLIATLKHAGDVKAVAFSPVGTYILTASGDKTMLWDANVSGDNAKPLATLKHIAQVRKVAFSPDGKVFLTASNDKTVKIWDANTREDSAKPLATLRHDNAATAATFSPDGKTILTGLRGPTAQLWAANATGEKNQPLATFRHGSDITVVAFSPDGKTIWTAGSGRDKITVKQWSVSGNDKPLATLELSGTGVVNGIAFSQDTRALVTGSDKTTNLWDTSARGDDVKPLATLKRGTRVWDAAFSKDGKYIVTGTDDGTVDLWNASVRGDNANPLMTLKLKGSVYAVAFSSNDRSILTGSGDNTTKLWDVRYADQLSLPAAQIVLYARQENLTAEKLPKHLLGELDNQAKSYLRKVTKTAK